MINGILMTDNGKYIHVTFNDVDAPNIYVKSINILKTSILKWGILKSEDTFYVDYIDGNRITVKLDHFDSTYNFSTLNDVEVHVGTMINA